MLNNVNTTEIISALNEAGITPEMLNNTNATEINQYIA